MRRTWKACSRRSATTERIYFFTNQLVSDKLRASTEDALAKVAGVPVHIMDRNWLADRVYRHDHLGLAISALQIEAASHQGSVRLGPEDTRREADLKELDAQISDPGRYEGARYQLVEDCVRAANLARGLDRPRVEIEGRHPGLGQSRLGWDVLRVGRPAATVHGADVQESRSGQEDLH